MIEHFRAHIAHKIGGHATAMIVCSSRPHALRFAEALRAYVRDHGYDTRVLVAFSGALPGEDSEQLTEARWNGFPDTQTAAKFDSDDYSIMSAEDATTFARLLLSERVDRGRLHAALGPRSPPG